MDDLFVDCAYQSSFIRGYCGISSNLGDSPVRQSAGAMSCNVAVRETTYRPSWPSDLSPPRPFFGLEQVDSSSSLALHIHRSIRPRRWRCPDDSVSQSVR